MLVTWPDLIVLWLSAFGLGMTAMQFVQMRFGK